MRDATGRETLVGRRFGSWLVARDSEVGGAGRSVACVCDCGNERMVAVKALVRGSSRSCGRCPSSAIAAELQAKLAGLRVAVGEMLPPQAEVPHALVVLDGCTPAVLNALEAAGGLRVELPALELVQFDGPRVSLRAQMKGKSR